MGSEEDHLRSVEYRLAHCRDETKRLRLQLARAISNAADVLNCLAHHDVEGARFNAGRIMALEEET